MSSFSGSYSPSLETLRQQAIALGLSPDQVKKYGDLRHKRTWLLAIEHYQVNQNNDLFAPALPSVMVNLPTDIDLINQQIDDQSNNQSDDQKKLQSTINSAINVPVQTNNPKTLSENSHNLKSHDIQSHNIQSYSSDQMTTKPLKDLQEVYSPPASFPQAVADHITALSNNSNNIDHMAEGGDRHWLCPQCLQTESASCYLCQGSGHINQVQLTGWLLAYLELLGCSAGEINILRDGGIDPQILNLIAHTSIAIRRTGAILQRTEKWITVAS